MSSRWRELVSRSERWLRARDPAGPDAPPLTLAPVVALLVAVVVSLQMFWRLTFPAMQDFWHHAAMIAIVADYHRAGSIYPDWYTGFDPLSANSLLYGAGALVAQVIGVLPAERLLVGLAYFAGVPLALLYALRVFGRDPWPAVLAVPLCWNRLVAFGFANMLFAAPLFVLSIPVFYRAIAAPTRRRTFGAALLFAVLFLGHGHLFLWAGLLAALITLGFVGHRGGRDALRTAALALAIVAPALALFAGWTGRAFFGASALRGAETSASHLGADFPPLDQRFATFVSRGLLATRDPREPLVWLAVLGLLAVATVLAQRERKAGPPVLELAVIATLAGSFFLPENLSTHEVIASRNVSIAAWLAPVFAAPVTSTASRAGRWLVIGAMLAIGAGQQIVYRAAEDGLARETAGLAEVIAAMPPRLRLHMVKLDPTSAYVPERALWHVEKAYMAEKFGVTPDTPALLATGAVHLKPGVDPHWIRRTSSQWPLDEDIWRNFDLVLVRRWWATPEQIAAAEARATLLKRAGEWEVWQRKQ